MMEMETSEISVHYLAWSDDCNSSAYNMAQTFIYET